MRKFSQQPKQLFIEDLGNVTGGANHGKGGKGGKVTTLALGEEDGGAFDPIGPIFTTLALGEEDGGIATTLALGEEDGGF